MIQIDGRADSSFQRIGSGQKSRPEKRQPDKNKELTVEERQILRYQEDMAKIREGNRIADLSNKLASGANLTEEEMASLRERDPESIKEYEEAKREQEAYRNQLKNCKTKEDVEKVKLNKMGNFMAEANSISTNPYIPKVKKIQLLEKLLKKADEVQEEHIEFTKSQRYRNLAGDAEVLEQADVKSPEEAAKISGAADETEHESQSPDYALEAFEAVRSGVSERIRAERGTGNSMDIRV